MRLVHQRHNNGCVSACLAMITGCSYNSIFRWVYGEEKQREYPGLNFEYIMRLVEELGISAKISFNVDRFKSLKNNAIIVVDYGEKPGDAFYYRHSRHAVVWDSSSKKILDPYPTNKRHFKITKKFCVDNFSFLIEF